MILQTEFRFCLKYIVLVGLVLKFVNGETPDDSENEVTDRISVAKCNEYQKLCPQKPLVFDVDGVVATAKEFPHMALIGYQRGNELVWPCGGTLISNNFILTAGHCVTSSFHTAQYVRLGDLDFNSDEDDADVRQFNVSTSILHPEYISSRSYNDIALLKIDGPVQFNDYIQPACLPDSNSEVSDRVTATGWGQTYALPREQPSTLQKVPLSLVSFDACKSSFPQSRRLPLGLSNETHLCAGSKQGEPDACVGFGGGPLNTERKLSCLHEIIGITSFGTACGSGHPGVYTRLASYIDWIESIVWPEK